MANALYDKAREGFLTGTPSISWTADTIRVALINTGTYTVNLATHDFYDDLSGIVGPTRASCPSIGSKTGTAGTANGASVTFTSVTGSTVGALVIFKDSGADATSPLIAYIDTVSGGGALSVTPNGGDITVTWDTGTYKIFKL